GFAAKQVLEKSGLEAGAPKLVQAESIRQALQFVQTGNAEARLVARSGANGPAGRPIRPGPGVHAPLAAKLGLAPRTGNPGAAKQLADFLLSDEGQKLLESFGFARVRRGGK